jgi:hypothetical protein
MMPVENQQEMSSAMNNRTFANVLLPALLIFVGGLVPASAAQPTVLGPEYTLTKVVAPPLQRDEKHCDYFLWTKLGGTAQRVSFSYLLPGGKSDSDTPRIENVTVVISPGKNIPTARMVGTDDYNRTLWQVEMAKDVYEANAPCLHGVTLAPEAGK